MKRRTLANLLLLMVVAGLAAFILLVPGRETPLEREALGNENPRAVSRVRLELHEGDTIELRRMDGAWNLVHPMRIAANDFRVNTLLRVLNAPVYARIQTRADELARFGLASPRARLALDGKEILFGDTESIHGRRYLLYEDSVALVDDAYFSHVSSSAANYVHPALLGRDPDPRIIVLPELRARRDGDQWRLEPPDANAGRESVAMLVDAWRNAKATAVRPYEPSLDWNGEIHIKLADGDLSFDVARTDYEVILGRKDLGIQYHLTKATGARLLGVTPPDGAS